MSNVSQKLSVIVHGGAGEKRDLPVEPLIVDGIREAVDAAWDSLCQGKPGEFAVAAALRVLEANEYFNAGYGGFPNIDGKVFLDCALMKGTGEFSALYNVARVKYPSQIALDMLRGGKLYARAWTLESMKELDSGPADIKERYGWVKDDKDLIAPYALRYTTNLEPAKKLGTVGCVVRDAKGQLVAGTSTGGTIRKPIGRIGDAPIIGAGTFADNELCALSTTGNGEMFLRCMLSGFIVGRIRSLMRKNKDIFLEEPNLLKSILNEELKEMERKNPEGRGGIIVIPQNGDPAYGLNSNFMSVGVRVGNSGAIELDNILMAL